MLMRSHMIYWRGLVNKSFYYSVLILELRQLLQPPVSTASTAEAFSSFFYQSFD